MQPTIPATPTSWPSQHDRPAADPVFLPFLLLAVLGYVALKLIVYGTLALAILAVGVVALLAGLLARPQDS